VHRRDRFRAHAATVEEATASGVEILTFHEVSAIAGDGTVEKVTLTDVRSGADTVVSADRVIAALGFAADLSAIRDWGLTFQDRHVVVDSRMWTGVDRIYAAGDLTEYPGKVRLIAVGFGEAATAINNAAVRLDPSLDLFPGHSTDHTNNTTGALA
jgi:thioredoxin reductase (NADPH)